MFKSLRGAVRFSTTLAAAAFTSACFAQNFYTGFESGYTNGNDVNGTNGWYTPTVTGQTSVSAIVRAYSGNPYAFPNSPRGQSQFSGNTNPGGTTFTRTQRDFPFASRKYTMSWDTCAKYMGTLPGTQNVGSVSLQDSTASRFFIGLMVWVDPATCANWSQQFNVYDAGGAALNNQSPGAGFANLLLDNWYRVSITWDLASNQIERVTIQDLNTNTFTAVSPANWYLTGGSAPTLPLPTGIRLFVGGATAGNTVGFDNVLIAPKEAVPDSFVLTGGTLAGGNVASLADDDQNKLFIQCDELDSIGVCEMEFSTSTTASSMLLHAVVSSARSDQTVFYALYNYGTNSYDNVGFSGVGPVDRDAYLSPASAGPYVNAATGKSKVRITYIPSADIDAGDGWSDSIDSVHLHVTP